jgi:MSHA biogenesis protein MshJ
MKLLDPLRQLADRLDAKSRRERLLLVGAIAVVGLLTWDLTVRAPLTQQHRATLDRIERTRADIAELQSSAAQLAQRMDEGGREQQTVAAIKARVRAVDERLAERTRRVIAPQQMVRVLRDVLAQENSLRLIRLENAGVEPLEVAGTAAAEDTAGEALPTIYRHRVELVVEGRYFALLEYLQHLEGLRWRFQWDAMTIETTDYPTARATLSLSTLSLTEDWIGV